LFKYDRYHKKLFISCSLHTDQRTSLNNYKEFYNFNIFCRIFQLDNWYKMW